MRDPVNPVVISTDTFDADFTDLEPLVDLIGDSRVVVLGEQTHSNGAATAIKARLVRFLHERMGFDILAWEAGMLDAEMANPHIAGNDHILLAARRLMLGEWTSGADILPMWEYARDSWTTARPLRMTGLDGFRAPYDEENVQSVLDELPAKCPGLVVENGERQRIDALVAMSTGLVQGEVFAAWEAVTEEERRNRRATLASFIQAAFGPDGACTGHLSERDFRFNRRVLERVSNEEIVRGYLLKSRETVRYALMRDQMMGDDLVYLANDRYAGEKIIVWAATAHFVYDAQRISVVDDPAFYAGSFHAGDHARRALGDDLYVLAVSAFGGEEGTVRGSDWGERATINTEPVEPPPPESFEAWAHSRGHDWLLLDLKSLSPDQRFGRAFAARPLGYTDSFAVWQRHIDALLFIESARPTRPLARPSTEAGR